jgi:hypothetical protein
VLRLGDGRLAGQTPGVADWRDDVDRWWGEVLGVPAAAMRAGGVFAASRFDHVGMVVVAGAAAPVVYGPADTGPALHTMLKLAGSSGALDADDLAGLLGPRASRVLGPAWYGYATAGGLRAPHSTTVRPLTAADLPLLARLHEQTPPAEREESGTTGLPAFGYLEDGVLLAVACLGMWQEMPTIGVLTHPRAAPGPGSCRRRRRSPRRPHRPACRQYRAWRVNTASLAVAAKTGFIHYGDGLVIHLSL